MRVGGGSCSLRYRQYRPGRERTAFRWRVGDFSTSHDAYAAEAEGFSDPDRLAGAVIS